MKSKAYRAVGVKEITVSEIAARLSEGRVWAGLDIGKHHTMVVIRDSEGTMSRPWKVCQPGEIKLLAERLQELNRSRPVVVALEPTGTYGDALRQALSDAGLVVHRVNPKAASDYSEVFDGVPSQHDGKDAAVVAELAAIGKSRLWLMERAGDRGLLHKVQWMDTQQDVLQLWLGRLEAMLARHWPELTSLLELNSTTLLRILCEYGGPEALRGDLKAGVSITRWGGRLLKVEKIEAILASSHSTVGVRMRAEDTEFIQRCARAALAAKQEIRQEQGTLKKHVATDAVVQRVGQAVGVVTACVLFATVGNPGDYTCGAAYRKALGLNLKERSSGMNQGALKITKRGPSLARRWLYFAALRLIQTPTLKPWYERKKSESQRRGGKVIVAVMRKLSLAIYAVARGATFDVARLLPGPKSKNGGDPLPLGALPPNPRNLTLSCQSQTGGNKAAGTAK